MPPDPGRASAEADIPTAARVHLAHAVVQHLAKTAGADVLHLKGPAIFSGLRDPERTSSDVDVLVRPSHLSALIDAMEAHGWEARTDFETGSPFAHAANWWHPHWGWADVHVSWPGAGLPAEEVFDELAEAGATQLIAHHACPVPDRIGQRLILLLHYARTPRGSDKEWAWDQGTEAEQHAIRALAARLDAEVALAAALDELHLHRDHPDHDLWRHFSQGGDRVSEWRARMTSARGVRARVRLALGMVRVNRGYLAMELGREPTRKDVRQRQRRRIQRAVADLRARR
jgi:hypothetical protein